MVRGALPAIQQAGVSGQQGTSADTQHTVAGSHMRAQPGDGSLGGSAAKIIVVARAADQ
jgi:hypothetical protein